MIEVFDEEAVRECLDVLEDSDIKDYALATLEWAINKRKVNAIRIPQNATNGDVLKAVFPNGTEVKGQIKIYYSFFPFGKMEFSLDWWNAPYKVESEEI